MLRKEEVDRPELPGPTQRAADCDVGAEVARPELPDPAQLAHDRAEGRAENVPRSQMVAVAIGFGFQNEVVSTIIFPINPRTAGRHPNLP